ncbi:MAG: putative peptide zinc metalloprotease protein [Pseudonocardiales bacterium]|nr:putative peptide zinc metalloprotease protein [Pseudonocardiales bacterium]
MLCRACRVHVRRDFPYCLHCGTVRRGVRTTDFGAPELSVDGRSIALVKQVTTIGRAPDNDVVLDDPSVSRHHARITRRDNDFTVEDLGSVNDTTVDGHSAAGRRVPLLDGAALAVGDVDLGFAQPRSSVIGGKTVLGRTEHTALGTVEDDAAPEATEPLTARPRRRSGWALKQVAAPEGRDPGWVLRNTRSGKYLQLDERDVFIWNQLDGEAAVRDVLFAYAEQFGELALPRIEHTLRTFAALDLIRGLPGQRREDDRSRLRRAGSAVFRNLMRMQLSVGALDPKLDRLYRAVGWRFFTRTGVVLLWVVILAGLYGFVRAKDRQELFALGGAGAVGVVVVALAYLTALVIHELSHALAVKSYGRRVNRGGFMLMMGMPFAFMDTSDMWFGSRWSRIVVALSGPLSTAALAGAAALGAAYAPTSSVAAALLFQLAYGLYMNTLYNFNPLMPLDGYQALADGLRVPRLREEAIGYFTRGVWRDIAQRRRPGLRQVGLLGYGVAALGAAIGFMLMALLAWRSRLGPQVHKILPAPWDIVALVAVIGVVTLPIWVRIGKAARRAARRARPGAAPITGADPAEVPA